MASTGHMVIIGICAGLALGIVIALLVYFGIRWYKKNAHLRRCANENSATTLPIRTNGLDTSIDLSASLSSSISVRNSDLAGKKSQFPWFNHRSKDRFMTESGLPRYSYKDIQKATQNFTIVLGQGSFGAVYKATMASDEVFAVKVLASDSKQGENEFHTEVSLLGRLHHRNLVNLVGYSVDKGQRMLIYEFMSNGSLANLLYKQEERPLTWEERVQIALDISHGVEYLHDGAVPPVIHRDLKSANILLDRSMRAKVADFGLSKEEAFDGRNSGLKGTYGYIDPAYVSTSKFTTKSDVYSFGIILFELITAIHPHQNLMEYINLAGMSEDGVDEIIDERLARECDLEEVRNIASLGHRCLHKTPKKRPSIREVSQAILKIRQKQLIKEDSMSFSGDVSGVASRMEPPQVELRPLASIDERSTA